MCIYYQIENETKYFITELQEPFSSPQQSISYFTHSFYWEGHYLCARVSTYMSEHIFCNYNCFNLSCRKVI